MSNNPLFREQWEFQEKRYPYVYEVLKQCAGHFISVSVAEPAKDMGQATDMVVNIQSAASGDVAVRIRRDDCRYRDLTIRSYNNGHKTEIDKIKEGFASWYLYMWEIQGGFDWVFCDVDAIRAAGLLDAERRETPNTDGGATRFVSIPMQELITHECLLQHNMSPQGWMMAFNGGQFKRAPQVAKAATDWYSKSAGLVPVIREALGLSITENGMLLRELTAAGDKVNDTMTVEQIAAIMQPLLPAALLETKDDASAAA